MSNFFRAVLIKKERSYLYTFQSTGEAGDEFMARTVRDATRDLGGDPNSVGVVFIRMDYGFEDYNETEYPANGSYLVFVPHFTRDRAGRPMTTGDDDGEYLAQIASNFAAYAGTSENKVIALSIGSYELPEIEVRLNA